MPTSEARILANKQNASRSTGPKTPEGKERSRANSLKHGMTGSGVVVPATDREALEVRTSALQLELAPRTTIGSMMVDQMALLSVRIERSARQETAALAVRVRHAAEDFDQSRLDAAETLMDTLADAPRQNLRKLLKSPEGVEQLILKWQELREDVTREVRPLWTLDHFATLAHLMGRQVENMIGSPMDVLSRAIRGNFTMLTAQEGGGLDESARKAWALGQLVERIDEQINDLEALHESFDFDLIDQDRAEAADRALFDPSKEATLARRYESEARRGFFHAWKELKRAEATAAELAALAPVAAPPPPPVPTPAVEPLGSFREARSSSIREAQPGPERAQVGPVGPLVGRDGQPIQYPGVVSVAG